MTGERESEREKKQGRRQKHRFRKWKSFDSGTSCAVSAYVRVPVLCNCLPVPSAVVPTVYCRPRMNDAPLIPWNAAYCRERMANGEWRVSRNYTNYVCAIQSADNTFYEAPAFNRADFNESFIFRFDWPLFRNTCSSGFSNRNGQLIDARYSCLQLKALSITRVL